MLKSQQGFSPEMKEQFSYRTGATSPSTRNGSGHVFFHKKKSSEISKNLCTTRTAFTLASDLRIRNTKRQHPAESLFSCLGTPPSAYPRRGRDSDFALAGRKAFVQITFFYSWAFLNSNDKNNKSCGSNVTNSCADVQMGNLQTNCSCTMRCADRLSKHWLCALFVAAW